MLFSDLRDDARRYLLDCGSYNSPYDMNTNRNAEERKVVFICWMVCSIVAVLSCYVIIRESIEDLRAASKVPATRKRSSQPSKSLPTQYLSMAVGYGIFAMTQAFGTIPAPAQSEVWGSVGNVATCTAQGFFTKLGNISGNISHVSVLWFHVLIVRYDYRENRLWKLVPGINAFVWSVSLAMSIAPIPKEAFNFAGYSCSNAPFPIGCLDENSTQKCIRGGDKLFMNVYTIVEIGVLGSVILLALICFLLIYSSVRDMENRSSQYAGRLPMSEDYVSVNRKKSNSVATHVYFTVSFFVVAFVIYVTDRLTQSVVVWNILTFFTSLFGFWVAVLFVRQREEMKTPEGRLFRKVICCTCCRRPRFIEGRGNRQSSEDTQPPHRKSSKKSRGPNEDEQPSMIGRDSSFDEGKSKSMDSRLDELPLQNEQEPPTVRDVLRFS